MESESTTLEGEEFRHILVPVDFSDATPGLVHYARGIARCHDSQVTLLHVVAPFHPDWRMDTTEIQREQRRQAEQALRELVATEFADATNVKTELREGAPVEVITQFAKQCRASIIVIASSGKASERAWMGSVAERVTRHAPCPVLVVR